MAEKSNGTAALTEEERLQYYQQAREDASAGEGWVSLGADPYAGDDDRWNPLIEAESCPDDMNAPVVSATLVVGKPYKKSGRLRESTLRYMRVDQMAGKQGVQRTLEQMREAMHMPMREDFDDFAYGGAGNSMIPGASGGPLAQYVPAWPGPVTRQLYWQDYWAMSAKAFEAYNHDPLSWRCVHMKSEFALGKGLAGRVTYSRGSKSGQHHDKAQKVWEEFWSRNKMDERLERFARDLCWGGEQFVRYFPKGPKLTVRTLDPASIYDLITDPEDIETVFAYHQQFQTAYQLYPPKQTSPTGMAPSPMGPSTPGAITRYIIRQIRPQEVDHYKINSSAFERRGRSDLFPALGWIKRLRDYLTSHTIAADMASRVCWDLEVQGNVAAIQSLRSQLFPNGQAPPPGTVFGHSSMAKLTSLVPQRAGGSTRAGDPILDALVTMVADAAGLPKDWLGFGSGTTRANALVSTEPAARSLEAFQSMIVRVIHDAFERVMRTASITDAQIETTFPSIATEDRSAKLDDIAGMEANGWLSHRSAASMAAKEVGFDSFNYDDEQKLIAQEFPEAESEDHPTLLGPDGKPMQQPKQGDGKPRRTVMAAKWRQAPKIDVTRSITVEPEAPGIVAPYQDGAPVTNDGSAGGNGAPPPPRTGPPSRAGIPSTENPMSAAGASSIRAQNSRAKESGYHQAGHQGTSEPATGTNHPNAPSSITLSVTELAALMREARGSGPRRRPDDAQFLESAEEYRKRTTENLDELVQSARTGK